ncbi:MAG TPA: DNA polymerase III subunit chi [Rhodoferax sp.]|nr:DNA polymerase III subunit chi [Rhodoferax sp.]HNV61019.1 DNA polymerase III subunit chi [Rhodoferax sp.]HPW28710.1 DNA polymerase III subunit chi [Rhodoferax sp.]
MTEIAFHFGAPDKLAYACRLLRKAAGSGATVQVLGDEATIAQLDADLWAVSPADFVSHCTAAADTSVRERSSVLLTTQLEQAGKSRDVLVNLGQSVPGGFAAFNRLIEVVSTDGADREVARKRWKFYSEKGYTITRHDLALKRTD